MALIHRRSSQTYFTCLYIVLDWTKRIESDCQGIGAISRALTLQRRDPATATETSKI